ncbi:MAG: sortase, partial [Anaerolineales bacterium]
GLAVANRQRLLVIVLAVFMLGLIIGVILVISAGGEDSDESAENTADPVDDPIGGVPQASDGVATATAVPTQTPALTPTPQPTIAPEVIARVESFPPTATPYIVPTPAGPRRLDIPVLDYTLPLPIVELPQVNNEWDVTNLGHNIGWLDNTTWLDPSWGNTVLVGHIQVSDTDPGPFNRLDRLVPWDEIVIYEGENASRFRVTDLFTVGPTENNVTHPSTEPILTLITCTNWDEARGVFSDRLVVQAVPAEAYTPETASES